MIFVDKASCVEGKDHEEQSGKQNADADCQRNEVSPAGL